MRPWSDGQRYMRSYKRDWSVWCTADSCFCRTQVNRFNVEASCHKHFVVFSHKSTPPLATSDVSHSATVSQVMSHNSCDGGRTSSTGDPVDNTWHVAALTACTKARYAQNRDFCLPHLHSTPPLGGGSRWNIAMPFGMGKL